MPGRRSDEAALRALHRIAEQFGVPTPEETREQLQALAAEGLVERVGGTDEDPVWRLTAEGERHAQGVIDRINSPDN